MSLIYEHVQKLECCGFICDCCHKKYDKEDYGAMDEMVSFKDTGGYYAEVGDMVSWSVVLCDKCKMKILGPYMKIEPDE